MYRTNHGVILGILCLSCTETNFEVILEVLYQLRTRTDLEVILEVLCQLCTGTDLEVILKVFCQLRTGTNLEVILEVVRQVVATLLAVPDVLFGLLVAAMGNEVDLQSFRRVLVLGTCGPFRFRVLHLIFLFRVGWVSHCVFLE